MNYLNNYFEENNTSVKKVFIISALLSFVMHVVKAWFADGYIHPDEHYQILEFAIWKLGWLDTKNLAWEFEARIRPALQPAMAYCVIKIFNLNDPFVIASILRVVAGIIGWAASFFFTLTALPSLKDTITKNLLILLTTSFWLLLMVHVRFSSESLSGSFVFAAIGFYNLSLRKEKNLWLAFSGILLGLAFVCRLQSVLFIPGILLWAIIYGKTNIRQLSFIFLFFCIAVVFGVLVDRWFYGEWVNTALGYFDVNVLQGKANSFGTSPWYHYFGVILKDWWAPYSYFILIMMMAGWYIGRKNIVTWATIPFFVLHCVLSHKEPRFLFPMFNALPLLMVLPVDELLQKVKNKRFRIYPPSPRAVVILLYGIFIFQTLFNQVHFILKPVDDTYEALRYFNKYYYTKPFKLITLRDNYFFYPAYGYHSVLPAYFYMPKNVEVIFTRNIDTITQIVKTSKVPVFTYQFCRGWKNTPIIDSLPFPKQVAYASKPDWMKKININNSASRTPVWMVYNLTPHLK